MLNFGTCPVHSLSCVLLSTRATMLLANTDPSDSHRDFVSKKARVITKALLKVFWPTAKGSLHHACCVLDYLLRAHTDEVVQSSSQLSACCVLRVHSLAKVTSPFLSAMACYFRMYSINVHSCWSPPWFSW